MKTKSPIRVTEVLDFVNSKWKEHWWRKVGFEKADAVSKQSRELGTKVHKVIEDYLNNCLEIEQHGELELELGDLVIQWLETNQIKPLYIEFTLEDKKLGLIGHVDLIAEYNKEPVVIDWKTSKKHGVEFALQKAAYAKMANKQLGLNIKKGITVRIDKEAKRLDVKEYENLVSKYWSIFLYCLKVYKYFR